MTQTDLVLWAGLIIGILFGACAQITGFCFYRGLHERWAARGGYKLQAFAMAMAVALAGTYIVQQVGLIDTAQSLYLSPNISWLLLPIGGLLFGYGMSLANGCGARALVLLAQGNLRSFVVILSLGIAAYMTLTGVLAPARISLAQATNLQLSSTTIDSGIPRTIILWVAVLILALYAIGRNNHRERLSDLLGGAFIGLLIVAGWLITGWLGADPFEPIPVTSLSFVAPIGDTIQYAMISTGLSLRFSIVVVLGVLVGALLSSLLRKEYELCAFDSPRHMLRSILGGILMGVGGVLAMGCTIGQGLTGFSTLSYSSIVAFITIIIGAQAALRFTPPAR